MANDSMTPRPSATCGRVIGFRARDELMARLDHLSSAVGRTRSALIRHVLVKSLDYLERNEAALLNLKRELY